MQVRVCKGWAQSYDPALKVARGDQLLIVKEDKEWAGWIWCTDKTGLSGWLPAQVFGAVEIGNNATAQQDFDTVELSVSAGETLSVGDRLNGWSWCRNAAGQAGWVPDTCLSDAA